jgi:putative alpha-1,2-mannosidase
MGIILDNRLSMAFGWAIIRFRKLQILIKYTSVSHLVAAFVSSFVSSFDIHTGFVSQLGALLTFSRNPDVNKKTTILARVGVSFISAEQACSNAESEIPNFDFEGTQITARAQWNELLSRVQVGTKGVDKEIVELFYSSVGMTQIAWLRMC